MKVGLKREDALCRSKWSVGVNKVAAGLRQFWPPSLVGLLPECKDWCLSLPTINIPNTIIIITP